ncbi:MAG: dehydratase [Bifidobacteriaceae bacterium]|jgi:acyl dehydratase|nr:dehydratase [Bifidobacteriaceae bacterium]
MSAPAGPATAIGPFELRVTRGDLVRYAGASGDFNPIHYSDDAARAVDLPGVIAHGMLTMGLVIQPLIDWAGGDPGAVLAYDVRFARPLAVPDGAAVELTVAARAAAPEPGRMTVNLTVTSAGQKLLGKAQAVLDPSRIPSGRR